MKRKFTFRMDCVHAKGSDIQDMTDAAKEITYRTFLRYVEFKELHSVYPFSTYAVRNESVNRLTGEQVSGLRLKNDCMVSYWKSTYRGKPCVYIDHSSIEYIFC